MPELEDVTRIVAQLQDASGDFKALLDRYGRPAPALRHLGLIQWHQAQMATAIAAFRAALRLEPDDPDTWRDLAGAYDLAGRAELAEACVRMSLDRDPDGARSWLLLGNLRNRVDARADAEDAFRRALHLDPTLADAQFALGLLHFQAKRLDEAVAALTEAVAHGYANALGFGALGHALYMAGRFAGSAAAFTEAARFGPLDTYSRHRFARARTFETIIAGHLDAAMAAYAGLAAPDAEDPALILRDAFAALSAYGHPAAAVTVGRARLAQNPGDATQRYLLDAVSGEARTRAPVDYVESYFDGFAKTFDQKLVEVLLYRVPEEMAALVAQTGRTFADTLDLGCGTGLAAAPLAPFAGRLTGVDISGRMLDEAARRGRYAALVKAEALAFLAGPPARFDLVFAADVLIYFGDLRPFLEGAARAIRPGGLLAVSTETAEEGDYRLLPSGRFAHAARYVEGCAAPHFAVVARRATALRLEANRPAAGLLLVLERRGGDVSV